MDVFKTIISQTDSFATIPSCPSCLLIIPFDIVNFSYGASDAGKAEVVTNNELEPRQGNIAEDVNVLEIVQETASEFAVKKMETSYF